MFLDVLENLMKLHKLNKNTLAKESGIPYTTIDGFWKKGYDNIKLSTLMKLSEYFEVSIDMLLDRKLNDNLYSIEEKNIITQYRLLDEHGRKIVCANLTLEFERVRKQQESEVNI